MQQQASLSRGQVSRALRAFLIASGIWGAWGQAAGIGTAVFTGFALHLGADGSFVSLFTSIAYFLALAQLIAPAISRHVADKKRFIIRTGFFEILFRSLVVIIPFFVIPSLRLPALVLLVGAGLLCGHAISPFYSTWVANTVPEPIRARFTSHQMIIGSVVAMLTGFAIGQFIDLFPDHSRTNAFLWIFALSAPCGWLGYAFLRRAPYPPEARDSISTSPAHGFRALLHPLANGTFRRAVLFYGLWTFAVGVAGPLYSVFMIEELGLSYTVISVYNAIFMVTSLGAYRIWAVLIDRFGSKAVLQLLILPAIFTPLLWVFNRPDTAYLVPVALCVSGVIFPGISVAITPLLYGLLPLANDRPAYLASWSVVVNFLGALGPLAGALLVHLLRDVHIEMLGYSLGHLQLIFAISAACRAIPALVLRGVQDGKGVSSRQLLAQMRHGNLLSYAYHAVIYNMASAEERRARAAYKLGRSRNPLAIDQLIQALSDASPRVRSSAARALGETGSQLATEPLLKELSNGGSDIRSEAAEALGRLGYSSGIDPLVEALEDPDPRVRISAIRGLAGIDREEVRELLFWHFSGNLDPLTFPTLVDVLGKSGDKRIITRTLEQLSHFDSPAIRLQFLDSVCQALGAKGQFYRLLSFADTRRTTEVARMFKRATAKLSTTQNLDTSARVELVRPCQRLVQAYDDDNSDWMLESIRQITGIVRDGLAAEGQPAYEVLNVFVVILAINGFLASPARLELPVTDEIFLAVCLNQLAEAVRQIDPPIQG